jgi:NADH-quinone oxidoreductase subunit J
LLAGLIWALIPSGPKTVTALTRSDNVREIGEALLTRFAIPFELASVVLLVAIVGALVLAKKRLE